MNQQVVFLSDGGDTVRDLQMRMSPQAEYVLDWFHVTMRLTLMRQLAIGLTNAVPPVRSDIRTGADDDDVDETLLAAELIPDLTGLKWNLWHGNVRRALELVDDLDCNVESLSTRSDNANKLARMLREFRGYIHANRAFIPNYGDRWRNGEAISTAFVESAVNQIISRRFVKKQQMRWTERGSHHLLQIRTRVLNEEWRTTMARWNPGMTPRRLRPPAPAPVFSWSPDCLIGVLLPIRFMRCPLELEVEHGPGALVAGFSNYPTYGRIGPWRSNKP